jgi:hypothetical protein
MDPREVALENLVGHHAEREAEIDQFLSLVQCYPSSGAIELTQRPDIDSFPMRSSMIACQMRVSM